jgi:ribosomal protein S18 acetylase RimI-like enzyme
VVEASITIRFLTSNDASAYWTVRLEALEREPEAFGSSPEEHRALSREEVARRLGSHDEDNFVAGAFDQERLVGTAGLYRDQHVKQRHRGHIWGVYVAQEARGKKVGRNIMKAVIERASAIAEIEQILLSVSTTQTAAMNLYRSLGFEVFGCDRRALKIGDRYIDEENMILFLRPAAGQVLRIK